MPSSARGRSTGQTGVQALRAVGTGLGGVTGGWVGFGQLEGKRVRAVRRGGAQDSGHREGGWRNGSGTWRCWGRGGALEALSGQCEVPRGWGEPHPTVGFLSFPQMSVGAGGPRIYNRTCSAPTEKTATQKATLDQLTSAGQLAATKLGHRCGRLCPSDASLVFSSCHLPSHDTAAAEPGPRPWASGARGPASSMGRRETP